MPSVRKRGSVWQGRVRVKGFPPAEKSFLTKSDAEAWAKITEAEMLRGVFIKRTASEQTTLAEALCRYECEITPHKKGAAQERVRVAQWSGWKHAKKSLANLRAVDFAQRRDERLQKVSPATVRLEFALVSHVFKIARTEWGYEGLVNPVKEIRLPAVRNARERVFLPGEYELLTSVLEPLQRDTAGRYGANCRNVWLLPLVQLALETAMRQGELLALKWGHIDLNKRVALLPTTKNGTSRTVPLSSAAVNILRALPRNIRGPVFPVTSNAVKLSFRRALIRARQQYEAECAAKNIEPDAAIMRDLHFHDLRHIATSSLSEKLQMHELARVTGHKDTRMLLRYYHPRAEDLARKLG